MRRLALRLAACLAALCAGSLPLAGCGAGRAVTVSPDTHDFGRVMQGETPEKVFVITNHSDRVVAFRAQPNCKCFGVNQALVPLDPGASREFRVIFDTTALPPQEVKGKWVTIHTDHPDVPGIVVPLEGEIYRAYELTPTGFNVGRIDGRPANYAPRVSTLRPLSGYSLEYVGNMQLPDVFEVEARDAGKGGIDVTFRLRKDVRRPVTAFRAKVRLDIELTAPDGTKRVETPVVDFEGFWLLE